MFEEILVAIFFDQLGNVYARVEARAGPVTPQGLDRIDQLPRVEPDFHVFFL